MIISYHPSPVDATKSWQYSKGFVSRDAQSFAELAETIGTKVWSPILWMDGKRKQDNFLRADLVALDFDDGEMSLEEACRIWCDTNHIIATTKSLGLSKGGKPACDRFRVILELSETISELKHYKETMRCLVNAYPCDPACKDGGRFFYPCRQIVSVVNDGYTEDPVFLSPWKEELRQNARLQQKAKFQSTGVYPIWLNAFLEDGCVIGNGRNHTVYCAVRRLLELGVPECEAVVRVRRSPVVSKSFSEAELESVIKSACDGHKRSLHTQAE